MNNEDQHIDPVGLLPKVLSGEANSEEIRTVTEWISASRENRKEYESYKMLWNLTTPSQDIDLDSEWLRMESVIDPVKKITHSFIRILQIAASIVLISALIYIGIRVSTTQTMRSPLAGVSDYNLPDGTKVSLNAGSKITYKKGFGVSHRNLALEGEGFFEVRKAQTPFIISAGNAGIQVTGTIFNISAFKSNKQLRVTVTEGSVKLFVNRRHEKQTIVHAGETGIFYPVTEEVSIAPSVDPNDYAWKTGIMEFNNSSLGEVTGVLQNTYHIPISIDTSVINCTITVRFDNQNADSVLNVLKSTLDLTITRKGKRILITGDGC
jgi:ferric-dicitrate binding protein FerR (iron transport regulator)